MADVCDQAQARMEMEEALRTVNLKPEAEATGFCLYCEDEVPEGHRWCDASCRDLWAKRIKK